MLAVWGCGDGGEIPPTARFFAENINSGNAEFWTVDDSGNLIGELYIFYNMEDQDFADGKQRAYLCAFRIREAFRGKGIGSRLLETVLLHLKNSGFSVATIGVEEDDEANIRLYSRFGFRTRIKNCVLDPCYMDEEMKPRVCPCFRLLRKDL